MVVALPPAVLEPSQAITEREAMCNRTQKSYDTIMNFRNMMVEKHKNCEGSTKYY
ncbi:hypothetical protein L195_g048253 [Trifolium pratense]|uniref:Uncharacterized protein n=1 Tax=Trifolium pratense TaxID=57577 RepID=A0A2K3JKT0_TRIPR|nr:hypothetical protein L195_g048253 [Trifolium pratense]